MAEITTNFKFNIPIPLHNNEIDCAKLLSGLGKATRRGMKKCVKCGHSNGTRSSICKNKQCGVYLRDTEHKTADLDAVKLITATARRVYSVRVRDMGSDYRGFVQLPMINNEDNNFSTPALCFVDSCQKLFDNSILKCHDNVEDHVVCPHINAALKSCTNAKAIDVNIEILGKLNLEHSKKEQILSLLEEVEGPIVQRVSKSVMAVKCQVTPKHPLGYLHFSFRKGKGSNRDLFERFYCSCTENNLESNRNLQTKIKCIHYFACICALASSLEKYYEEFGHFISNILPNNNKILKSNVPEYNLTPLITRKVKKSDLVLPIKKQIIKNEKKDRKFLGRVLELKRKCKPLMPKTFPVEIKILDHHIIPPPLPPSSLNEENSILWENKSWAFIDWLSYVTESINQTMKFDNCGIINTLIFHIPEDFYGCFKSRIPLIYGSNERNINDAAAFYIMNILHLKEIFDTPKIKLKIAKKFVQTDAGFVEYDESDEGFENNNYKSTFIFFLNVGQSTVDESDNTNNSFVIEWLPRIFPLMEMGQLKIQYKYGRKST